MEQENFGNGNYLDLINEVLDDYGAIVIPDNKYLRFYPKGAYGKVTEQQIRYKYNTDDVKFDIDTFALKTQIRGSGKKMTTINIYLVQSHIPLLNLKNGAFVFKILSKTKDILLHQI